jgi:hypothetical protein
MKRLGSWIAGWLVPWAMVWVLALVVAPSAVVVFYWEFFDNQAPITILDRRPIYAGPIHAGDILKTPRSFCVERKGYRAEIIRKIVDHVVYTLPDSFADQLNTPGCPVAYIVSYTITIPNEFPPGLYCYQVKNLWFVNPIKKIPVYLPDMIFQVVPKSVPVPMPDARPLIYGTQDQSPSISNKSEFPCLTPDQFPAKGVP